MESDIAAATGALFGDLLPSSPIVPIVPSLGRLAPHPVLQHVVQCRGKNLSLLKSTRLRRPRATGQPGRKRRLTVASASTTLTTPACRTEEMAPSTSRAKSTPLTNCSSSMTTSNNANQYPLPLDYLDELFDKFIAPTIIHSSPLTTSARE